MNKLKVIIYGLGQQYRLRKKYLELVFDIIGYCDIKKINIEGFISVEELCKFTSKIYITSNKYYDEIKESLVKNYQVDENRIIGEKDTCWYSNNELIRDKWVIRKIKEIPGKKYYLMQVQENYVIKSIVSIYIIYHKTLENMMIRKK